MTKKAKQVATDKSYNGWKNYETWNVNLWLGNDSNSYEHWQEMASEAYNHAQKEECFTKAERATLDLAESLKSEVEEGMPDLGASMYSDLLGAALSSVNWYEIACHMIDGVIAETECQKKKGKV